MKYLRSLLFVFVLIFTIPPIAIAGMLSAPFSPHTRYRVVSLWARGMMPLIRIVLGIRYRVIGAKNMPDRPSIVMAKHQSMWETISAQVIFPPLSFVLKRELLRIPFFGWGLAQMPVISIDRAAGKEALMQVQDQGCERLKEGFWVMIYPEGTRLPAGAHKRYKVGGGALAVASGAPVVPMVHNAGEFWPKSALLIHPGEIVVSIGPAIDPTGLSPAEVTRRAETWMEEEMHRLFPHLYNQPAQRVS